MPRSYDVDDVVERYVDLQRDVPGSGVTLRGLAASMNITPQALYRYVTSLEAIEIAAAPLVLERAGAIAGCAGGSTADRLAALARTAPGWLWCLTRLDSTVATPSPVVVAEHLLPEIGDPRLAVLVVGFTGNAHGLCVDAETWARTIERVVPRSVELAELAVESLREHGPRPVDVTRVLRDLPERRAEVAPSEPVRIARRAFDSVAATGRRPSVRDLAAASGDARSTIARRLGRRGLEAEVRNVIFADAISVAGTDFDGLSPLEMIRQSWQLGIELCFDHPGLVDVFVGSPAEKNPFTDHQVALWARVNPGLGAQAPCGGMSVCDWLDVLAGFVMCAARSGDASRTSVSDLVGAFVSLLAFQEFARVDR